MTHRICLSAFVLLAMMVMAEAHAQTNASADSTSFAVRMQEAWKEISQLEFPDSLQRTYGWEFFNYYQKHPDTETGVEAGWQSFLLWTNAGAVTDMDEALAQLSNGSDLWSRILQYVEAAYAASEHRDTEDLYALLKDLETRLTHPASRSAVLLQLARYYQAEDEQDKAQALFQEIVNLDAHTFFVDQALGALYEAESLNLGQQAPAFAAETMQGDTIVLADFRGEYVLIEFWSTWCGPCMPEIPHLQALWTAYRDRGLQIIGVALEVDNGQEAVERFIEKKEMEWPQIVESSRMDGEMARLYNVVGIPNSYLIGPDGMIVAKHLRGEKLEQEIRRLMESSGVK